MVSTTHEAKTQKEAIKQLCKKVHAPQFEHVGHGAGSVGRLDVKSH